MQIVEAAVLEVAAVKALVRKVDVFKSDSAGVESDNFLVLVYVVVNVFDDFLFVGSVVKAIAVALGNFAVVVEDGKRSFFAAFGQALALLEHNSIIKQAPAFCKIKTRRQRRLFYGNLYA